MNKENSVYLNFSTEIDLINEQKEEIKYTRMEDFNISQGFYFALSKKNKIKKYTQHSNIKTEKGEEIILRLRKSKNNNFTIENPINKRYQKEKSTIDSLYNKIWYILNTKETRKTNNNKNDYIINKNDIIRFGNSMYEVIEKFDINKQKEKVNIISHYDISSINKSSESIFKIEVNKYQIKNEEQENLCRICFDGSSSPENPKICICKCNDYIHYYCLKAWIKTKLKKRENQNVVSYFLKKFCCDVCLTPYPLKFKIAEIFKEYSLINLNLPKCHSYFVLESLENSFEPCKYKSFHVVKLNKESFTFGRNERCDIVDIRNISKFHAVFKYNKKTGNLILENRSERFDSYVLVKNPIIIKNKKIDLKISNTYVIANINSEDE